MQYITPRKKDNTIKKRIAIVLIILSSIGYFALFSGILKFLRYFIVGFFGLFAYPLFFAGYALSYMLFKDKQFVMPKRFIVYISLAVFSLLCIFHLAFSSGVTTISYGAYLSELYNSQMSVGGLLIGLITYPLIISVQPFGAYVVFVILLIFCGYKILDYFLINKNSKNYTQTNKKQNLRIEEVKISSSASDFLNEQLIEEESKNDSPKITIDAEIDREEMKRQEAKNKLGLNNVRNQPIVNNTNKQLDTFNQVYNTKNTEPIFEENSSREEVEKNLTRFDPFNNSSFTSKGSSYNTPSKKERNLAFLRATLDRNYNKNTTEEIASQKPRNLNLEDNLRNLPINDFIKEEHKNDDTIEKIENEEVIKNDFTERQEVKEEPKTNGDKISDIKIDDLINKVKTMEKTEKVEPEIKKYKQTNLLETEKTPTKATYRKPSKYVRPTTNLLNSISTDVSDYGGDYQEKAQIIERTLENFKVPAKVIGVTCGPSVTRFELEMPPGISVNKINQYSNDIAMALASSHGVRIEAPIPGKSAVGIEVPNDEIATVGLKEVLDSREFYSANAPLTFALGKDINGTYRVCNIEKMPHLLIAGSTGSGKSVCLNVLLISLLYKCSPEELRLILVDPKRVEFSMFNNLPHMLIPEVICNSEKAINALNYLIKEMERRYALFEELYVKKLEEYNQTQEVARGDKEKLPYIVMIIDEMNDLMSTNKKEIEDRVIRIAQKARAAGIHLILATQRPSVDVLTGTIKNNLPSRIAFAVTSYIDSKTILDRIGAEKLLGKGDMLYFPQSLPEPQRIQCAFVSNEELKAVIDFVKANNESIFNEEAEREINKTTDGGMNNSMNGGGDDNELDSLMPEALKFVIEVGHASISKLQRRFGIGFSRAGRIVDQMERLRYVSPADGSKPRMVYITMDEYNQMYGEY